MASDGTTRPRGRPRKAASDAAILKAAIELIREVGSQGATLTAVAERAGVARATVYLRWPTRSAMIGAAARAAVGGQVMRMVGDVEADIRFGATFIGRVFDDETFIALLPEIVRGVVDGELSFDQIAPRRVAFAQEYRTGAAAAGFDPAVDPNLPFDILLGTAIARLLATGRAMTDAEAGDLADIVVRGLRRA